MGRMSRTDPGCDPSRIVTGLGTFRCDLERAKGIGSKPHSSEGVGADPPSVLTRILTSFPTTKLRGERCVPTRTGRVANGEVGEGLRTAAGAGRASGLRAAVGKPPKDERAGVASRYGDLAAAARARRRHGPPRRPRPWCREPSGSVSGDVIRTRRRSWQADGAVPGSLRTVPACLGASVSDGRSGVASALCWIWPCRVTTPSSGSPSARGRSPGAGDALEALDHEHAPAAAGAWGAALCRRGRLGASGGAGTASSSRARAMLALHRPVASRP